MIIKHGRHVFGEIHEMRKGLWAFFLDCFSNADWLSGKLRSRAKETRLINNALFFVYSSFLERKL